MTSFYIVLLFYNSYFTTCLRKWLKDSLTCPSKHVTKHVRKGDKFLSQFCLWFQGALWAHFIAPIDIIFYFCLYFRPNANKYFFNFSSLCCLLKCFGNRINSTLFEFFGFCSLVLCETVKNGTLKIL